MIRISGKTHIGRRKANEDRIVADSEWGLALVADGMGGPGSGDVASQIVARTVTERIGEGDSLAQAIVAAHEAVRAAVAEGKGNEGMGTTVVVARFDGYDYEIAWVGDSRAYLFDGEKLVQLTRDHSQLEHLLAIGELKPEDAEDYPAKNVITRAMGIPWQAGESVPVVRGTLAANQSLLLCSDGLNDAAGDAAILRLLKADRCDDVLQALIDASLEAGGADNISVVLCRADDDAPAGGSAPDAVAIVTDNGDREYFPAEPDAEPAGEIETTRIQMVQPGSVQSSEPAHTDEPGKHKGTAGILIVAIAALFALGAAALFYFDII